MDEINLDDLVCIDGEKGVLSRGKSGFVRAGFYKTYTPVAIKCSGFNPDTKYFTVDRQVYFDPVWHDYVK